MNPKLSVVIGTYNQKQSLKMVLESFFDQSASKDDYEIIVIDSSSQDDTEETIKSLKPNCELRYIRVENKGKPEARNRGIKEAKGEIILLTDADMIADKNLVSEHLKCREKYENAAIEGLTYNLKKLENFKKSSNLSPYIQRKLRSGQRLPFYYFLSGNLSIKKKTLEEAGLFDPVFSGYGWEDIELGYRMEKMSIPLIYYPEAFNYHYHIVKEEDLLARGIEMGRSAAKFYKKHKNLKIKYFLGMNPLAVGIYRLIKNNKFIYNFVESRCKAGSKLFYNILKEYNYRDGLSEALKELGVKL